MESNTSQTTEKVLGLDPRALLARARTPERAAWSPPEVEELAPLLPGFVLEELIGRGGMGAVYRARQPSLDRVVALKLLPRTAAADAEFAGRFRTEARALARLQHPHIVTIYECGETEDGHLFYVMEYVEGSDLSERLARGPLPVAEALAIARAVCEALEYAHTRGIIHRDIKPANVLLGSDGSVKVADFGLAKELAAEGAPGAELTMTGAALGTPSYMSPEQRAGRPVDARADLYSLGVMLYEMLTGELPQGAWQPPSRKSDSSPRLDAVVEKSVQPDPALRVQSAAELRARLERIGRLQPPGILRRPAILASAAALVLAGGGGLWWWLSRPPAEQAAGASPATAMSGPDYHYPVTPPGTFRPLEDLNMLYAVIHGTWSWLEEKPGGTLLIAYTHGKPSPKMIHLPLRPWPHGWNLECQVLLEHKGGDLTLLLPAGSARPALVLDLYDTTGLEYIRGAGWKTNATTLAEPLPTGRFLPLRIEVRPNDSRVSIKAELDGRPLLQWEGPQSDLYLAPEQYSPAMTDCRGPVLTLMSTFGGAQIRVLVVTVLP